MQNGSYGLSGDLKPSFLHSFSPSDVNKRPLTDGLVGRPTCNATLSLTLRFINRAAMGRARFLLYTGFIFRRFFFVGD